MKPYGVVFIAENLLHDFGYAQRGDARVAGSTGMAYFDTLKETGDHMAFQQKLWWTDTLVDAETLARKLSSKHSNGMFIAFTSTSGFTSKPSDPIKSVFTSQGIVPA